MIAILQSSGKSLGVLLFLTFIFFLENFYRYFIAVSPIPYIDYSSYEYSVLAGPAFTVVYSFGGLVMALMFARYNLTSVNNQWKHTKLIVLSAGTFVFSGAFIATAVAVSFWQQCLIRIMIGIAQSIVTPFSTSIISDLFPSELRGSAFGIFSAGTYFAFSLSLSLGTFVYKSYGWKAGYYFFGIAGILAAICIPVMVFFGFDTEDSSSEEYTSLDSEDDADDSPQWPNTNSDAIGALPHSTMNPLGPLAESTESARSPSDTARRDEGLMIGRGAIRTANLHHTELHLISQRQGRSEAAIPKEPEGLGIREGMQYETLSRSRSHSRSHSQSLSHSTPHSQSEQNHPSILHTFAAVLYEIFVVHWRKQPAIYLLVFATGVRLGGGYIWSAYTSVFFSDLFVQEDAQSTCTYSNANAQNVNSLSYHSELLNFISASTGAGVSATGGYSYGGAVGSGFGDPIVGNGACGTEYPYCVSGSCNRLSETPWHNKGMSALLVESFFCWIPLVGSAMGNILGGVFSDYLVKHRMQPCSFSLSFRRGGSGTAGSAGSLTEGFAKIETVDADAGDDAFEDELMEGGGRKTVIETGVGAGPGAGAGDSSQGVPFVAGLTTGAAGEDASVERNAVRLLVAGTGVLLALPLVVFALLADYPWCFLVLVASGLLGELYLSEALVMVTLPSVCPPHLVAQSVALFMFAVTILGGNMPLIIPLLQSAVGFQAEVLVSFTAAKPYQYSSAFSYHQGSSSSRDEYSVVDNTYTGSSAAEQQSYTVYNRDASKLQYGMIWAFVISYGLSGLLYIACYLIMRRPTTTTTTTSTTNTTITTTTTFTARATAAADHDDCVVGAGSSVRGSGDALPRRASGVRGSG